ncbi:MAG: hypothetical protein QXQ39_07350 [Conexivisphaerales archaeon]
MGLPPYLDLSSPMIDNAIVALWASYNIAEISGIHKELGVNAPLTPLLMGGIAVKMLSKNSNEESPLNRTVKDIDYVVKREKGSLSLNC